ncbi:MAG: DUF4434 domain-containing protein [Oscillospiraceae bacterium]|nr:DUF4434 domain-containing protein [Oscillospiraceae bacterium]
MKRLTAALISALLLTAPASAASQGDPHAMPLFEASFLQGWLCRGWTPERWMQEMQDMKAAGFRSVILQSAVDLTYGQTDSAAAKTDPAAYACTEAYALYPAKAVSGSADAHALSDALSAAKQTGMQVWIGTVSDSRWWNYGWGVPDDGFAAWSAENAAACGAVVREVTALYGEDFGAQIAGFYYNNEIWNFDAACAGTDGGKTADILAENLRGTLDAVAAVCPEKPLLISPFFNRDLSSAAAYAAFWGALADRAGLRQTDIIAHQDGAGRAYDTDTLSEWASALHGVLRDRVTFWVNNETFRSDRPLGMADLKADVLATDCAKRHILFSWNHYYHAAADEANAQYERDFGKLLAVTAGDLNDDGECSIADAEALYHWLRRDRIALQNWTAGDLDGSGSLNAVDLALLKRRLLSASS